MRVAERRPSSLSERASKRRSGEGRYTIPDGDASDRGNTGSRARPRQGSATGRASDGARRQDSGHERTERGPSGRQDTGRRERSAAPRPAPSARRDAIPGRRPRAVDEPVVPAGVDIGSLDRSVRAELRSLPKATADEVAAHLVRAGDLLDSEPRAALRHARAARARASRIAAVREAVGIAAYRAEEWADARSELRAARRLSGDPSTLPLIADCERALGRPGEAARLLDDPDVRRLDPAMRRELLIVVAGARRDLGQLDAALSVLARGGLDPDRPGPGSDRLWYAYADALESAGRRNEAAQWFAASAAVDVDGATDAAERAAELG
jgi:hypothetical protein